MDDGETPARRLDRWLARGAGATTTLATLTLFVSLVVGVEIVATTALSYALVVPAVAAGALVVAAMVARATLVLLRGRVAARRASAVALLRSLAFGVELVVVVCGVVAVGWGFDVGGAVDGRPTTAPSERVVYGAFGLFVLIVGTLPVYFRAARRIRED